MGNNISIGDSLIITIFSMAIVFVVLIAISYLIDILRVVTNEKKGKEEPNKSNIVVEEKKTDKMEEVLEEQKLNDEELIAVIAAAVAVSLGVSVPEVNIKSIKRTSSTTPLWAEIGRREQILGKL